jgi:hypothetical protein
MDCPVPEEALAQRVPKQTPSRKNFYPQKNYAVFGKVVIFATSFKAP